MILLSRSFLLGLEKEICREYKRILRHISPKIMPFVRYLLQIRQSHRSQINSWRAKHNMAPHSCDLHLRRKAKCGGQRSDAPKPGNYSEH